MELLVVIGLIAALAGLLATGLRGSGEGAALQSAQATIAGLVTAARTKAPATGRKTRLLVNVDPVASDRFLRRIVLQLARQTGASPADWDTVVEVDLPDGIYVVPASLVQAAGLIATPGDWKRISDPAADLVSDLFQGQMLTVSLPGDNAAQAWTGIAFTSNGTLATLGSAQPPKGSWLVAAGMRRAPGSFLTGESPVQLVRPQAVRGLLLSAYGIPALLNDRSAF